MLEAIAEAVDKLSGDSLSAGFHIGARAEALLKIAERKSEIL
jgi:hypothetical protein